MDDLLSCGLSSIVGYFRRIDSLLLIELNSIPNSDLSVATSFSASLRSATLATKTCSASTWMSRPLPSLVARRVEHLVVDLAQLAPELGDHVVDLGLGRQLLGELGADPSIGLSVVSFQILSTWW